MSYRVNALICKNLLTGQKVCHKVRDSEIIAETAKKLRERAKLCTEQFGHYYRRW